MTGFVKHWADLFLGMGSLLTVIGSLLNVAALSDRPDPRGDGLTWRMRFVAENRRHPRLRSGAISCLSVALIFEIGWAVTLFG